MSLKIALWALFCLATGAARANAPAPTADAIAECGAFSQAGMRACLEGKARDSASSLKRIEDAAMQSLSRWEEDTKYVADARKKLTAANAAFEKYREAQCTFAQALGGGAIGNALEMRRLACIAELNSARAASLRESVAKLPTK